MFETSQPVPPSSRTQAIVLAFAIENNLLWRPVVSLRRDVGVNTKTNAPAALTGCQRRDVTNTPDAPQCLSATAGFLKIVFKALQEIEVSVTVGVSRTCPISIRCRLYLGPRGPAVPWALPAAPPCQTVRISCSPHVSAASFPRACKSPSGL